MLLDARAKPCASPRSAASDASIVNRVRVRIGQGVAGWVAHNRKPLFVRVQGGRRPRAHRLRTPTTPTRSSACRSSTTDRLIGVLNLSNKRDGEPFDELGPGSRDARHRTRDELGSNDAGAARWCGRRSHRHDARRLRPASRRSPGRRLRARQPRDARELRQRLPVRPRTRSARQRRQRESSAASIASSPGSSRPAARSARNRIRIARMRGSSVPA